MSTPTFTPHPDDLAYAAKVFINELDKVQDAYFQKLIKDLDLNEQGEEWLFDYIYNYALGNTFTEYLEERKKKLSKLKN